MILISKFYIFLYFFYSYFGYNVINRIINNKKIDYALLDKRATAFIGKRLCMLSHLFFLYSAYYLENPNNKRYLNIIILHIIVNSGYYINWGLNEISTSLMHMFWGLPVIFYNIENIKIDYANYNFNNENISFYAFLLIYSQFFSYIYTPRIKDIDKEE